MENIIKNGKKAQEWSHYIIASDIESIPVKISVSAPKDNFSALCNRLNLHSIDKIDIDIVLKRNPVNKVIHVKGHINAKVYQKCIVTTDPVLEQIDDDFEAWYAEPSNAVSFAKAKRARMKISDKDEQPMLEECDDPEEILDGSIDIGELAVQHLSLALNPYPRIDGVNYENQEEALIEEEGMFTNPFAALKDWKVKEKKKD